MTFNRRAENILTGVSATLLVGAIAAYCAFKSDEMVVELRAVQYSPVRQIDYETTYWNFSDNDGDGLMDDASMLYTDVLSIRSWQEITFQGDSAEQAYRNLVDRCESYNNREIYAGRCDVSLL
jgi:hypothetical protein